MLKFLSRNKNKCIVLFLFLFTAVSPAKVYSDSGRDWNIEKSKHFIIYYKDAPYSSINELAVKAERYYKSITHFLGYRRFNFWTWGNRCRIYLYPSRNHYLAVTGAKEWSRAHVDIREKRINAYLDQDYFFDTILPHEMAHIIFREFVGFDKKLPLCLDEGIACSQEEANIHRQEFIRQAVAQDIYIPVSDVFAVGRSNFASVVPAVFYAECSSIISFLLREYGRKNFIEFCRKVRDGGNWKDVLFKVYRLRDFKELEDKWLDSLEIKEGGKDAG